VLGMLQSLVDTSLDPSKLKIYFTGDSRGMGRSWMVPACWSLSMRQAWTGLSHECCLAVGAAAASKCHSVSDLSSIDACAALSSSNVPSLPNCLLPAFFPARSPTYFPACLFRPLPTELKLALALRCPLFLTACLLARSPARPRTRSPAP
jgi:hypothetical protein